MDKHEKRKVIRKSELVQIENRMHFKVPKKSDILKEIIGNNHFH